MSTSVFKGSSPAHAHTKEGAQLSPVCREGSDADLAVIAWGAGTWAEVSQVSSTRPSYLPAACKTDGLSAGQYPSEKWEPGLGFGERCAREALKGRWLRREDGGLCPLCV